MTRKLGVVVAALGAFVALSAFRGGCGPTPQDHMAMAITHAKARLDSVLDELKATPEQRSQIHDIAAAFEQGLQASRPDNAKDERVALLQELTSDQPDAAKLHAAVDQRSSAMQALAHEGVDSALKAMQVLTPAQRAQLRAKLQSLAADGP